MDKEAQVERQTAAMIIDRQAERLTEISGKTLDRVTDKLTPIMNDEVLVPEDTQKDEKSMPPLFSSLRHKMYTVEMALHQINALLDRVEL